MGLMNLELEFREEKSNLISCKCKYCEKLLDIKKDQLKYLSPMNYEINEPGVYCECGYHYTQISKGIKPSQSKTLIKRNKYSFTNILVISIGGIFIVSVLFLMGYGIISSISFDSPSKNSLEKYYESHPDAYRKDMKEQGQIQDIKKDLQNKIDEQNLK